MSEWSKGFDRTPLEPEKPWSPAGSRAIVAPPLLDLSELAGNAEGRYAIIYLPLLSNCSIHFGYTT